MTPPSLWERLRRTRAVQIFLVYLGASWVVLQIVETLGGLLTLPPWIGPFAVVLLLIGLVVVMATAWVQSLPRTAELEKAGEVPTDWEVAPADILDSLRRGEIPHLTWGRAIMGGVMAMSLLVGGAGLYVLVKGPIRLVGPTEAGAEDASRAIAVLPFHVTGPGLELYREGMVDLVSANLDGLSGYRSVDARTVIARWNREIGVTAEAELDEALRVAAGTGARYAIVGNGVELGDRIRFNADIWDLDTGEEVGTGQAEGEPERVLALVDALTVDLMRSLLEAGGDPSAARSFRLASLLTGSVPALRSYLEGEAAFRRSRFDEARDHLERAVAEDSTFALAHWRLGEAIGWTVGIQNAEGQRQKALAARFGERLPPREQTLLEVSSAISVGNGGDVLDELGAYLRRYPEDPDGWYSLGEIGIHDDDARGLTDDRVEEALLRAPTLDPTFGPYYQHALEWTSARGQAALFDSLFTEWLSTDPEAQQVDSMRLRGDLLLGEGETLQAAVETVATASVEDLDALNRIFRGVADERLARWEPIGEAYVARGRSRRSVFLDYYYAQGRLREAEALLASVDGPAGVLARAEFATRVAQELGERDPRRLAAALAELRSTPTPGPDARQAMARVSLASLLDDRPAWEEARADMERWLPAAFAGAPFDTTGAGAFVGALMDAAWLNGRGQPDEALARVRSVDPPPFPGGGTAFAEAEFAFLAGRWAEAARIYEGASRAFPGRSLALFRLGRAYAELGQPERSADAYRRLLGRLSAADDGHPWLVEAREALGATTTN